MSKRVKVDKIINEAKEIGFENEVFQSIYTVIAHYDSDRESWTVCSYENEELADEHAERANEYIDQVKVEDFGDNPYDVIKGTFVSYIRYSVDNSKLIKRVMKWPLLKTIFIARYKEVESAFHKDKLPIEIFKLICKRVANKYSF